MIKWLLRCPLWDTQYCIITSYDALDCVAESFCHIFFMITGVRVSPRALAVMARLDLPENRNFQHVLDIANAMGLVRYENCPTPNSFTAATYYAPLTALESQTFPINVELIPFDLTKSPGWTVIQWGINSPGVYATNHAIAELENKQYFDSEQGNPIKPLNYEGAIVNYRTSIKITKGVKMLVFFQVAGSPTIWSLMDGTWVGFADETAFNNYVGSRPNAVINISLQDFQKLQSNPDVFKS